MDHAAAGRPAGRAGGLSSNGTENWNSVENLCWKRFCASAVWWPIQPGISRLVDATAGTIESQERNVRRSGTSEAWNKFRRNA